MSIFKMGKIGLGLITALGIQNIVGNIVKSTTPPGLNTFNKLSINVATFVVSGMIANQANKYLNREINDLMGNNELEETKG